MIHKDKLKWYLMMFAVVFVFQIWIVDMSFAADDPSEHEQWTIFHDDMDDYSATWGVAKGSYSNGSFVQGDSIVTIEKSDIAETGTYHYLTRSDYTLPDGDFTLEFRAAVNGPSTGNEITLRFDGKLMSIYLSDQTVFGTVTSAVYEMDTTSMHSYKAVAYDDKYDVYVDDQYVWSGVYGSDSNSDLIKIGAGPQYTVNLDLDYVRMGEGVLVPDEEIPVEEPEPAPPKFPKFIFDRILLEPEDLGENNVTNEIFFPTVIIAEDYFAEPLGKYYMYFGPHDPPGGIYLAYADQLEGPWTIYGGDPIIKNNWEPYYNVSHVASPSAIWNDEEDKLFLYFHGENTVIRLASSEDGIHFEYEGVAVDTSYFHQVSETSNPRVFAYTLPGKTNKFIMLNMGNNNGSRKIYLSWSDDGRTWTSDPMPLISPTEEHGYNFGSAFYFPWEERHFVVVHASTGHQYVVEVGENFDKEIHHGLFFKASSQPPDNGRAASPFFLKENGKWYMVYEPGTRYPMRTSIALAREGSEDELEDLNRVTLMIENTDLMSEEILEWSITGVLNNNETVDLEQLLTSGATIEWHSSDEAVVSTEGTELVAKRSGEAQVHAVIQMDGVVYETNKLTVTVTEVVPFTQPQFKFEKVLLSPEELAHLKPDAVKYPAIWKASDFIEEPLGTYYMYFDTHNSPSQIGLAYADSLEGPWMEYDGNPILSDNWDPYYAESRGVQFPTFIWNKDASQMFMYFNAPSDTIRLATSEDGLHFEYVDEVLTTADFNDVSEISNPKVFEYQIPGKDNKYIMLVMGNQSGTRKIFLAWSKDGLAWEVNPDPIVSPNDEEQGNVAAASYFQWEGRHFVVYHASSGKAHITEVGESFDMEIHHGVFYEGPAGASENEKVSTIELFREKDHLYLFYAVGASNQSSIALATAEIPNEDEPDEEDQKDEHDQDSDKEEKQSKENDDDLTENLDEPMYEVELETDGQIVVKTKTTENGLLKVEMPDDVLEQALAKDNGSLSILIQTDDRINHVEIEFPEVWMHDNKEMIEGVNEISVHTELASVTLGKLKTYSVGERMLFSIEHVQDSEWRSETGNQIGDRPVVAVRFDADTDKQITSNQNDPMEMKIAYSLRPGESPHQIVVYQVGENGEMIVQKNVRYDDVNDQIIFNPKKPGVFAVAYVPVHFRDLNSTEWAVESIEALAAREIVVGIGDGRYNPQEMVTRAEFIHMLMNMLEVSGEGNTLTFKDVDEQDWYFESVLLAAELGIIQGYGDERIGAQDPITRQDLAVILYRAGKLIDLQFEGDSSIIYSDYDEVDDYATDEVRLLTQSKILNGYPDGTFQPQKTVSRAEAAVVLYNLLMKFN